MHFEGACMSDEKRKSPDPMDLHVGGRVRLRRMMLGISQDKLGDALGLTFQQIQKYEKGTNRIGAGRLYHMSKILNVPINFFYEDFGNEQQEMVGFAEDQKEDSMGDFMDLLSTPEGVQLCKSFSSIKDVKIRRKVLDLIKTLSDDDIEL
jgi:transcriptional regulator with XRE-family HTH domain